MSATSVEANAKLVNRPDWLELVLQQVSSLRYGVVQITVHDSRVTQVEKTERVRLDSPRKFEADQ
jgi:hypothetical protein